MLALTLFNPTAVAPYYLAIKQALDQTLGPPKNLSAVAGGVGGTLLPGTYFYKVTALDGQGGETTASNEASVVVGAGQKVTLTWNVTPNAWAYNVYRSNVTNTETILTAVNLPVLQPAPITTSVTYTDDGTASTGTVDSVSSGVINSIQVIGANRNYHATFTFAPGTTVFPTIGSTLPYTPGSNALFGVNWTFTGISGNQMTATHFSAPIGGLNKGSTTTGGSFTLANIPPIVDTTVQTELIVMPSGAIPVSYSNVNVAALFPASLNMLNSPPSGGSGGAGTNGIGNLGNQSSTPNGGIAGMVCLLPQFAQFTNRMVIALGNGFFPQLFLDSTGTKVNPAPTGSISTVSVDAFGVVTVTTSVPHGILVSQVGANVYLSGILNAFYNTNGNGVSAFVIIAVPSTTTFKVVNLNAIGQAPSSGGTFTISTVPIINTFIPAYPVWSASTVLSAGDLIVPLTQPANAIYLTVIQGGTTGGAEPTWPTGGNASVGQNVKDGTVIYQVAGLLNAAAPSPPGAAQIAVYSGALWVFNTAPTNTANGLDGPCSLRQSSINNPNSWNPVNQAFLDKDDGSEGMGLAKFTITAQGIPPQGSLIAFKNYSPYQIIGVFGAPNLQIQAVSSDMGCLAPRTITFVPGFGIMRYTHLGVAVFNGVKDEIVSEQIRPYIFPDLNRNFSDITAIDANWVALSWSALTANPPQYCMAAPIGDSGGMLTRIFAYDLVLKGWDVVDLGSTTVSGGGGGGGGGGGPVDPPIGISCMAQVRSIVSNPLTILGGFLDGVLSRWQAGDLQWYTGGGVNAVNVAWAFRTLTVASGDTDQRVYTRRLVITGSNTGAGGTITISARQSGGLPQLGQTFAIPVNSDFDIDFAVQLTGKRFDAIVSSNLNAEIDGCTWELEPRPAGVVVGV
jgi:hypothetical protein